MSLTLATAADWIAWSTLVFSVAVLAWAAYRYTRLEQARAKHVDFEKFYRTLERVHNKDQSLILQRAAIFELRNFPEYRELILRLCRDRNNLFPESQLVQEEFLLTQRYFEGIKN